MKITLEATGTIESVPGIPARRWHGTTESGIEIDAWIPIIRVRSDADNSQFESELREVKVVREPVAFDLRLVL